MTQLRFATSASTLAVMLAIVLTGCTASGSTEATEEAPSPDTDWPRTVEVPHASGDGVAELTIAAEPQRIAALDYESTEVLAELGLGDRLVLIPEAVLNPALGSHIDELTAGPDTFPVAMEIGVEHVIGYQPDLVVMSPRHGNEAPIADVLQDAGVAVLQLPTSWVDSASLLANIELIGEATGTQDRAVELVAEIENGLSSGSISAEADGARVMVLTNQAGRPFITAGDAFPLELLSRAGAQNVAAELGITRTAPVSAEQLVHANPDGIVLIDMNGSGDRMFAELLDTPAVSSLSAIAGDRILRVQGRYVQALGLNNTVQGLSQLTEWLAELSHQG